MISNSPCNSNSLFTASTGSTRYCARAKYYILPDGSYKLASIQKFNSPRFTPSGWETRRTNVRDESVPVSEEEIEDLESGREAAASDVERATRRARKNAFDMIMCNSDLDVFCTFTYSPERVSDKADYDECYRYLNTFLSNRVQRNGLKYVCVPERTRAGDIHFHAIMNSSALKLTAARNPHNGRALKHNGKQLYNIADWSRGFTSCEFITDAGTGADAREAVSKYIFKYMGKQQGQKIGGRYCLIGGELLKPVYVYADAPEELFDGSQCLFSIRKEIGDVVYEEYCYI